ncbi:flagellar hook-basal body complex protein FliE [Methylocystis sp. WRRC1]|uniref:flagellar hook-basal body complex protein FliE n=1 Tax=unclassified Methylocystis TaxID=2625913 RepID=UPI0001F87AA9|nr:MULTISPECIES: flagellar hook-basal body complex protein FliE [unclassified Methylocystis]MCC3244641.1 flagellar hook-basal body complex protein FliE [Methylocystis sp. WRRC1]
MTPLVPIISAAVGAAAETATTVLAQAQSARPAADAAGSSFGEVLQKFAADAVDSLKSGEAAAISGVEGKLAVHKVVDAIMSAERDLNTVIALRDKAVNAYQEISRMAI